MTEVGCCAVILIAEKVAAFVILGFFTAFRMTEWATPLYCHPE
jgi:hypothetical protein